MMAPRPITLPTDTDEYVRTLDRNLAEIQRVSEAWQDAKAIERYEESLVNGQTPQLLPNTYVLRQAHSTGAEIKLRFPFEGPYKVVQHLRPDFVEIFDVVNQLKTNEHRRALVPVPCRDDAEAREFHRRDSKELIIKEIISHTGDEQKRSTLQFQCTCEGLREPLTFNFASLKLIPAMKAYITEHPKLEHLRRFTIDTSTQKRRTKGTYKTGADFDNR